MQTKHSTTSFYLDMIYRLQMKRIAAGYTQEDLSFLLGYQPDRVSRIEAFDTQVLVLLTDLTRLALIFNCELLALTPGYPIAQQKIEILTDYDQDSFTNSYTVYQANTKELLYKVIGDNPEFAFQAKDGEALKVTLREFIDQLINDGYFIKGAEAWDIYAISREQIKYRYSPRFLQEMLQEYVSGNPAQLEVREEENRFVYYPKK